MGKTSQFIISLLSVWIIWIYYIWYIILVVVIFMVIIFTSLYIIYNFILNLMHNPYINHVKYLIYWSKLLQKLFKAKKMIWNLLATKQNNTFQCDIILFMENLEKSATSFDPSNEWLMLFFYPWKIEVFFFVSSFLFWLLFFLHLSFVEKECMLSFALNTLMT